MNARLRGARTSGIPGGPPYAGAVPTKSRTALAKSHTVPTGSRSVISSHARQGATHGRGAGRAPSSGPGAGGAGRSSRAVGGAYQVGHQRSDPRLLALVAAAWIVVGIVILVGMHAGWKLVPGVFALGVGMLFLRGAVGGFARGQHGRHEP